MPLQDTKEFDDTFDKIQEGEMTKEQADAMELLGEPSTLSGFLDRLFKEYESDRRSKEDQWIRNLRQFRGEYSPDTLAKMHPKRSKAFLNLTRAKVRTFTARQMDLLFPANGEKNWSIEPTPLPELNPQIIESIQLQYQQQTGQTPEEEVVRRWINVEAETRADAMEKEMADQLAEIKYRSIIRQVLSSGNTFGTGVLKGPLTITEKIQRWLPHTDEQTGENEWITIEIERSRPYAEYVPIWDIYPDMSVSEPSNMRGVFQRYVMNKNKLYQLSLREDFMGDRIRNYMQAYSKGDHSAKEHEQELKNISSDNSSDSSLSREGKYELLEFWGYVSTDDLVEEGVEIKEELRGRELLANIWKLGSYVVKAVLGPIEGAEIPYHFYYYNKDDSNVFGEGIPSEMEDPQKLFNASVRAMLDNAAISAGPLIEANMDLLEPDEDPKDLFPFRVFLREGHGVDAQAKALNVYSLPSYTREFMSMIEFFLQAADEVTSIPRYLQGETDKSMSGVGRTATGMSMLMGAVNINIKNQIKYFDDYVTVPFIKAQYFWNMNFSPKEYIKGDFNCIAKGSTSLIAREVKSENLLQFLNITNNPTDLMYTKRDNVLRELTEVLDLDEYDLVKDRDTVSQEEKQRAAAQQKEEAFLKELAMIKAMSGGHMGPTNEQAAQGQGLMPERPDMQQLTQEDLRQDVTGEILPNAGEGLNG